MKTFSYEAKDGPDRKVTGQIVASDKQEVVVLLENKGLTPVVISEKKTRTKKSKKILLGKIKARDLISFSKQLAGLLKSGVPILRALRLLSEQTENAKLRQILLDIAEQVERGLDFSAALCQYPKVFSEFFCSMIKAGEDSGSLDKTLYRLTDYYEKRNYFLTKIQSAILYPAFILVVGFATVVFILTNVMPKIIPILTGLNVELHVTTRLLISLSSFLKEYWSWGALGFVIVALITNRAFKNVIFREYIASVKTKIPLLGQFLFKADLAQFFRALSVVLESGIPIVRAIKITAPVLRDPILKRKMLNSAELLEKGGSWGVVLKEDDLYPPIVGNLISLGEETGNIKGALNQISEMFEDDTEVYIKTITTLLEPTLILVIGIVVGFIVMALLLPIFELNFSQ